MEGIFPGPTCNLLDMSLYISKFIRFSWSFLEEIHVTYWIKFKPILEWNKHGEETPKNSQETGSQIWFDAHSAPI